MPGKLTLTVGVPGCGKSTWSKEQLRRDPENTVIVERDELRTHLFTDAYHQGKPDAKKEKQVSALQAKLIEKGLQEGKHVINSDTNLNNGFVKQWVQTAKRHGADFSFQYFDVDSEECRRRNRARGAAGGRLVPEDVMDGMILRAYGPDGHLKEYTVSESNGSVSFVPRTTPGMEKVKLFNAEMEARHPFQGKGIVFVDVDGTLANNAHHAKHFLNNPHKKRKDFPGFYKAIAQADANKRVVELANRMRHEDGLNLVVLTGRDDSYARELLAFVRKSGVEVSRLYCKRDGDFRPDKDYKHEVIQGLKDEGFIPVHALDDREGSIATMTAHGITVSKVDTPEVTLPADGSFPVQAPAEPAVTTTYGTGTCIRCGSKLKQGNIGRRCATKMDI